MSGPQPEITWEKHGDSHTRIGCTMCDWKFIIPNELDGTIPMRRAGVLFERHGGGMQQEEHEAKSEPKRELDPLHKNVWFGISKSEWMNSSALSGKYWFSVKWFKDYDQPWHVIHPRNWTLRFRGPKNQYFLWVRRP